MRNNNARIMGENKSNLPQSHHQLRCQPQSTVNTTMLDHLTVPSNRFPDSQPLIVGIDGAYGKSYADRDGRVAGRLGGGSNCSSPEGKGETASVRVDEDLGLSQSV